MRRKHFVLALAGAGVLAGLIAWQTSRSQPGGNGKVVGLPDNGKADNGKADNGKPDNGKKEPDPLPIKQVVLFNSGVGYFQREGEVDGNARVSLSFPTGDINDLLKSLILQDLGGGRVNTVNYDSHDPIDKILRSFALNLNNNPSYGEILNQARGEKIEILRQEKKDGQGVKVQGVIVGMEVRRKDMSTEEEIVNVATASGLQNIPLSQVLAVRFLNQTLEAEFQRALQVLAQSHDSQKKTVSVGFTGNGKRPVKVGYVVERPIWKTTYRLSMEPNGKLFLQAWALVENTSDDDWNDVRMTLVSGRPISYKMNLYEPLYIPRPTVEPDRFASLRPPVYSGSLTQDGDDGKQAKGGNQLGNPPFPGGMQFGQQGGTGGFNMGGVGGLNLGGFNMGGIGGIGGLQGQGGFNGFNGMMGGTFQGGFNGNLGGFNRYQNPANPLGDFAWNAQQRLTFEELQKRLEERKEAKDKAKKMLGAIAGLNFKEGIDSIASAEEIGDYHQYAIDQKVTLPRQKSAMLPILNQTIEGTKVSIFNERVHFKYPLLGLRLKNTSKMPLTQGPVTVYEDGSYAGDTRFLDVQPDETRLLSYALDQSMEIKTEERVRETPKIAFEIGTDRLTGHYKYRRTRTYLIKNRSPHHRQVVIEHPISKEWELVGEVKPQEKSRDFYRFVIEVPPGAEVKTLEVNQEQTRDLEFALKAVDTGPSRFLLGAGIEVVPVPTSTLGDKMELKLVKNVLHARHMVRESRTYSIHNHSKDDRSFQVKHLIRSGWKLVGAKEDDKNPKFHQFELAVPAGKMGSKEVVEEKMVVDMYPLVVPEDKPARYVLGLGVEVEPLAKVEPDALVDLRIAKGMLHARYKKQETTTLLVKNNLDKPRTFQFEHVLRPEWRRRDGQDIAQTGPDIYRFEMPVGPGKTSKHDIVEEKVYRVKESPLLDASEKALKDYLADPALTADVKAALTKVLALRTKLHDSKAKLADLEGQLKTLSDDQARLRSNLQIIPQTAEPYKKFLQKFVDQEVEIETFQRQIRQLHATVQSQQREYEMTAAGISAE